MPTVNPRLFSVQGARDLRTTHGLTQLLTGLGPRIDQPLYPVLT